MNAEKKKSPLKKEKKLKSLKEVKQTKERLLHRTAYKIFTIIVLSKCYNKNNKNIEIYTHNWSCELAISTAAQSPASVLQCVYDVFASFLLFV